MMNLTRFLYFVINFENDNYFFENFRNFEFSIALIINFIDLHLPYRFLGFSCSLILINN